jgi:hypothetical protein
VWCIFQSNPLFNSGLCILLTSGCSFILPFDTVNRALINIQGGSNMTGTDCGLFTHKSVPVIFESPCSKVITWRILNMLCHQTFNSVLKHTLGNRTYTAWWCLWQRTLMYLHPRDFLYILLLLLLFELLTGHNKTKHAI